MTKTNRRGFFGLLAGAVATAFGVKAQAAPWYLAGIDKMPPIETMTLRGSGANLLIIDDPITKYELVEVPRKNGMSDSVIRWYRFAPKI